MSWSTMRPFDDLHHRDLIDRGLQAHDGGQQYLRLPRHEVFTDALKKSEAASIINISSSSALAGYPHFIAYGAAKAAVRSLTMSVAVHCQTNQFPIRCNSVHPDGILTDMTNNMEGTFPEMEPHQAMKAFSFACEPRRLRMLSTSSQVTSHDTSTGQRFALITAQPFKCPICRLAKYEISTLSARHISNGTYSN